MNFTFGCAKKLYERGIHPQMLISLVRYMEAPLACLLAIKGEPGAGDRQGVDLCAWPWRAFVGEWTKLAHQGFFVTPTVGTSLSSGRIYW